jgi:hypothetical protein
MKELPEYFQHHARNHPDKKDLYNLRYDAPRSLFLIGSVEIAAEDYEPHGFNPYAHGVQNKGIDTKRMAQYPLLLPGYYGRPIGGPRLHEYVASNPESVEAAVKVMIDLFSRLEPQIPAEDLKEGGGFMGFNAYQNEDTSLRLQVFGNCACLGVSYPGVYLEGVEKGFAEYDLHNADSQSQRASLYAGLGHLAFLASEA